MADPFFKDLAFAALAQTARNPTRDFLQATPRNPILGYLSDLAASSYSPERTQQMQGVAKFMSAPAISETLDRLSYGEPLTTGAGGLGGTTRVRPEALEAAMTLAPMVAPTAQFTKGLPVGMSIKSVDDLVTKYPNVKAEKFINPSSIKPLNKVEDRKKYNEILESMKQEGWQGRPILAYEENGKTKALTGSHRIYAARKAGIDVPVVFVKPSVMKWEDNKGLFGTFKESINDQRVYEHLKAAGDDTAASLAKLEDVIDYDASGKFIAREEVPVQQAMNEFEQSLINFMATPAK